MAASTTALVRVAVLTKGSGDNAFLFGRVPCVGELIMLPGDAEPSEWEVVKVIHTPGDDTVADV